jgi:hypothetical protein
MESAFSALISAKEGSKAHGAILMMAWSNGGMRIKKLLPVFAKGYPAHHVIYKKEKHSSYHV